MDGQGTRRRIKIAENFNRLSRAHQRYRQTTDRQTTDGTAIAYSECDREFTFANKVVKLISTNFQLFYMHKFCNPNNITKALTHAAFLSHQIIISVMPRCKIRLVDAFPHRVVTSQWWSPLGVASIANRATRCYWLFTWCFLSVKNNFCTASGWMADVLFVGYYLIVEN